LCFIDTEKFYTLVQEKTLADYGKNFDWTLKAKMMGKKALEAGTIFVEETSLDGILSPEDFIKRREMMLHGMFPDGELMPGIFSSLRFFICHMPLQVYIDFPSLSAPHCYGS
jgi:pseudouridine-5'-monophosphatase